MRKAKEKILWVFMLFLTNRFFIAFPCGSSSEKIKRGNKKRRNENSFFFIDIFRFYIFYFFIFVVEKAFSFIVKRIWRGEKETKREQGKPEINKNDSIRFFERLEGLEFWIEKISQKKNQQRPPSQLFAHFIMIFIWFFCMDLLFYGFYFYFFIIRAKSWG